MIEVLRSVLSRAERPDTSIFTAQEVARWPRGSHERLVELGLLREIQPADEVLCDECDRGCYVRPDLVRHPQTGEMVAVFFCLEPEHGGRIQRSADVLRQWEFSFDGLLNLLAEGLDLPLTCRSELPLSGRAAIRPRCGRRHVKGLLGRPETLVPGRLAFVGALPTGGGPLEVFVVRGLRWDDGDSLIDRAPRLKASPGAAVLTLRDVPEPRFWRGLRPAATLAICDHISWDERRYCPNVDSLEELLRSLRPSVPEEQWLTVTGCARLLMRDLPHLTLKRAQARVSKAANTGHFATNGRCGQDRRIERSSFDAWRLAQRDRDLDEEDRTH